MKQIPDQQLKWELARERFQLEDISPPLLQRPERSIGDILDKITRKDELEPLSLPEGIVERWPGIAGEQLAKHVRPSHLKKGVLYLYADHPGWLAELKRLPKTQLINKIALIKDVPEVTDIRFQLDPSIRTGRINKC